MSKVIETEYDNAIRAYIVSFPERISLKNLRNWEIEFQGIMDVRLHPKTKAILLNTNKHDFESIECLKLLRDILTRFTYKNNGIRKIAFVQSAEFRQPGIFSENEAYFEDIDRAKIWLQD